MSHWFGLHPFVKFLHAMRCYTIQSKKVQARLLNHCAVPDWNYAIRMMCGDRFTDLEWKDIDTYKDSKGFAWGLEYEPTKRDIPFSDDYQPSRHFLYWLVDKDKLDKR